MQQTWSWEFTFENLPALVQGMLTTIAVTIAGILIAVVLGLFLALGRRSDHKWVSYPTAGFIEFVRSTPLLIQLFFLFYALPQTGLPRWLTTHSPFATMFIALGIHYGCYASEAYRAGIESVPKGQWEAARSLNLRIRTTWRSVILPQAVPRSLPPLGNYFVAMFKDAPIGSAITLGGVLFTARSIASDTFRVVEVFTVAGLLFLTVSIPAAMLVRRLERRVAYESD